MNFSVMQAKPVVRTPNRSVQSSSRIPAGPRIGPGICSPSGDSSKTKPQPARAVAAAGDMKVYNSKTPSPVQSQKLPNASINISSATGFAKNCDSVSPRAQNETVGESCSKGLGRANDVSDNGLDAEKTWKSIIY